MLPALPGECRQQIAHAAAVVGANAVIVLARERAQLDLANSVIKRCADNHDTLKKALEGDR